MDLILGLPIPVVRAFFTQFVSCVRLLLAMLIFSTKLRRKQHFHSRLFFSMGVILGGLFLCALLRVYWVNGFSQFLTRLFPFPALYFLFRHCYDESRLTNVRMLCIALATKNLGSVFYSILLAMVGANEQQTISLLHPHGYPNGLRTTGLDWVIYFTIRSAVYWVIARLSPFRRQENLDRQSLRDLTVLTVFCFAVLVLPDTIDNSNFDHVVKDLLTTRFYLLAFGWFVLFSLNSVDFQSKYRQEKAIIEQVLTEERKQYHQLKANMDVINLYCHDLRHQLEDFSGKLSQREIDRLASAMDFYDSNIKTDCEVLDVVLRSSQLSGKKDGIQITCMADGKLLGFMETRHLYFLFNNALGNAMEAVRKLPEEEKRVISVTVERQENRAVITVTNYYDGQLAAPGDTTKKEKGQHGFGLKSMDHVAQAYGGRLAIRTDKNIYCLTVFIPIPHGKELQP